MGGLSDSDRFPSAGFGRGGASTGGGACVGGASPGRGLGLRLPALRALGARSQQVALRRF